MKVMTSPHRILNGTITVNIIIIIASAVINFFFAAASCCAVIRSNTSCGYAVPSLSSSHTLEHTRQLKMPAR